MARDVVNRIGQKPGFSEKPGFWQVLWYKTARNHGFLKVEDIDKNDLLR